MTSPIQKSKGVVSLETQEDPKAVPQAKSTKVARAVKKNLPARQPSPDVSKKRTISEVSDTRKTLDGTQVDSESELKEACVPKKQALPPVTVDEVKKIVTERLDTFLKTDGFTVFEKIKANTYAAYLRAKLAFTSEKKDMIEELKKLKGTLEEHKNGSNRTEEGKKSFQKTQDEIDTYVERLKVEPSSMKELPSTK